MFELSGVNYEEVLEQGDSILVRVITSSSYHEFELSGVQVIGIILYITIELIIMNGKMGKEKFGIYVKIHKKTKTEENPHAFEMSLIHYGTRIHLLMSAKRYYGSVHNYVTPWKTSSSVTHLSTAVSFRLSID